MHDAVFELEVLCIVVFCVKCVLCVHVHACMPSLGWGVKLTYFFYYGRASALATSENIDIPSLGNAANDLSSGDIGKGLVVQPGRDEFETAPCVGASGLE